MGSLIFITYGFLFWLLSTRLCNTLFITFEISFCNFFHIHFPLYIVYKIFLCMIHEVVVQSKGV